MEHLPAILDKQLAPQPQDDAQASYDALINKHDGVIDWQQSAITIERQIRAYANWPKSRTNLGGHEVVITAAHVLPQPADATPGVLWLEGRQLGMHTKDGILVIDQLVPAGKKPMAGSDFLLGYRLTV